MPAYPPSRIEVVSPTSVAAPCRLEATDMAITDGTGEILSFCDYDGNRRYHQNRCHIVDKRRNNSGEK